MISEAAQLPVGVPRRRTKVAGTVDYYAQIRAERAAERADVAIVVCDAFEGVTTEDMRVAEVAMKKGCATILALNKWDIARTDLPETRIPREVANARSYSRYHRVTTPRTAPERCQVSE